MLVPSKMASWVVAGMDDLPLVDTLLSPKEPLPLPWSPARCGSLIALAQILPPRAQQCCWGRFRPGPAYHAGVHTGPLPGGGRGGAGVGVCAYVLCESAASV